MMKLAAVILAAGLGTRMKSKLPKVMHPVAGKPMLEYVVETARANGIERPVVVVGHQSERIREYLGDGVELVEQPELRGTGDAVKYARAALGPLADTVIVLYGDMPLLRAEALRALVRKHQARTPCLTLLTVEADEAMGFGRVVRDVEGKPLRIVEEAEATPAELRIRELNCGVYCFNAQWLWANLDKLQPSPKKGEYYLTDLVGLAAEQHAPMETAVLDDVTEVIGINTRVHLARAEQIMRDRIRENLMLNGVTLIDPGSTYVDAEVEIGPDSTIWPGTYLRGKTRIGSDCRIGPNAEIRDSQIGDRCEIGASSIDESTLHDRVKVGPYCHLRPGTVLGVGVHLGDHAELKKARLGPGTKVGHFSYLGDAEVGARVNIGAGTITCNYDGKQKHRTVIGDDAFIGSDTLFVAPVTVGARARTGAGAVVTHDLPADSLAYGVPARVIRNGD